MITLLALAAVFTILVLALELALYYWHSKRLEARLSYLREELALARHQVFHPTPFYQFEMDAKEMNSETKTDPEE